jgi:dTMP kinase
VAASRTGASRFRGVATARPLSGFFVALEGIEGSGKTTVAQRLASAFRAHQRDVTLTREPGGSAIGEQIRALLLGTESSDMTAETEALLFAASRAALVSQIIRPALRRGEVVIVDRFMDSSLAYQWGGRGLSFDAVLAAQALATGGLHPDLKLLLDLPVPLGLRRRFAGEGETNRLDREAIAFHERVREAYLTLATSDPERWRVIDASRPEAEVWSEVWNAVIAFGADRTKLPANADQVDHGRSS